MAFLWFYILQWHKLVPNNCCLIIILSSLVYIIRIVNLVETIVSVYIFM